MLQQLATPLTAGPASATRDAKAIDGRAHRAAGGSTEIHGGVGALGIEGSVHAPSATASAASVGTGGGGGGGSGGTGVGLVNGVSIVASIAASITAEAERDAVGARANGSEPVGSRAARVPAMACVCTRFRAVCRRRAVSAWLALDGVNAPVACFHPRGQTTTLLHVAAADGMEATVDALLARGAQPLALDSCSRTPLQVARGRASLIAKLMQAQAQSETERRAAAKATDDGGADGAVVLG